MKTSIMMTSALPSAPVGKAWEEVSVCFDRFCLAAGLETLGTMMQADAEVACGPRHSRSTVRRGHRWGRTAGKIGFHAGKVAIERPRVRGSTGRNRRSQAGSRRSRGLARPVGDEPDADQRVDAQVSARRSDCRGRCSGAGRELEYRSRRPPGISWRSRRPACRSGWRRTCPGLDLLVVQIDGIHMTAIWCWWRRSALTQGREASARAHRRRDGKLPPTVQALIDNLLARGLDPAVPRLFIIDGSKALSKAIRRNFGRRGDSTVPDSQGPQHHGAAAKAIARYSPPGVAPSLGVGRRRKGREVDPQSCPTAGTDAPGVSASILEGLDEILTVTRLGLPKELRRALACTNMMENVMGTVRRVCRNVKRWRSASMALRWTASAMQEAAKGFRQPKAHKQLPALRAALASTPHEKLKPRRPCSPN